MTDPIVAALVSGVIGAAVGVATVVVRDLITSARHTQRLDEHDRRFDGVDKQFSILDERFVPRNEINARLESLDASQKRIETSLSVMLAHLAVYARDKGERDC